MRWNLCLFESRSKRLSIQCRGNEMFCRGCGKQLNDGALFCPKCGQKTGNQMYGVTAEAQANTSFVNPVGNANQEPQKKKKHTAPIVISMIAVVMAIAIGGTVWFRSQLPDDVDTGARVSSSGELSRLHSRASLICCRLRMPRSALQFPSRTVL